MAGQHYCLRWNNYQSNMTSVFHQLLRTEAFVDVTLACNDETLKAHKVVLSACSSYFQKLLLDNPCRHPTIIMPQDVCFSDLKFIIEFVYKGEIDVSQTQLQSLLKTADQLKIKGLCEVPEGNNGKDMVSAEVTPLPLPTPSPAATPRRHFNKLRRLTATAKRKLDTRRQLYKAQLQKRNQEEEQLRLQEQQQQQQQQQQQAQMMQTVVTSMHESSQQHNQMHSPDTLTNCITVATSTEDDDKTDVLILESRIHNQHQHHSPPLHHHTTENRIHNQIQHHSPPQHHHTSDAIMMTSPPPIMSTHAMPTTQIVLDPSSVSVHSNTEVDMPTDPPPQPTAPAATLVASIKLPDSPTHHTDISVDTTLRPEDNDSVKVKFETLRAMEQSDHLDMDSHLTDRNIGEEEPEHSMHTMMITPELLGLIPSSSVHGDLNGDTNGIKREPTALGSKTWTQEDMDSALEALRTHSMSLTKASITYGIPSTTLWQRAHRLGIDTPKKDGPAKSWTEDVLNVALEALRNGIISANKASKAYGIPSSTLYKIARREGIRLAAPFNAAPTTWNPEDLERALEAIRSGQTTVQRAATEYGIPSGTLYGRCKREGIELSRSNPTPWSEDAMTEALEAVRMGQMSINQAAIHYNLPYSSLYGRFKRVKYEADHPVENEDVGLAQQHHTISPQIMLVQYQQAPPQLQMYQHAPS